MRSRFAVCIAAVLGVGCGDGGTEAAPADSSVEDTATGNDTGSLDAPADSTMASDAADTETPTGDAADAMDATDATDAADSGSACPKSTFVDISAGQGASSGTFPSAVVDTINGKLLVVTQDGSNANKPSLFRCNLDGASCTHADLSAGQGAGSGSTPSAVVDAMNAKLLVATDDVANGDRPGLFRCNLDGTGCTYVDISAGQPAKSGYWPSAVIDTANSKLLVVTQNGANSNRSALFRCNLDGTGCTYTDISAFRPGTSGMFPSAVVDTTNDKLLVVTQDGSFSQRPSLFRCNLDGTSCSYADISASGKATCGGSAGPSAVIDAAGSKLLVVVQNLANAHKPALLRCGLDGTGCTYADLSAGAAANSGLRPSAVIDAASSKLLVASYDSSNESKPALFRCELDGTGCAHSDVSAGEGPNSGIGPSAVLDTASHTLLVAVQDGANADKPGLFVVCLP